MSTDGAARWEAAADISRGRRQVGTGGGGSDAGWHLAQITGNLCSQREWAKSSGALCRDMWMSVVVEGRCRPPASQPASHLLLLLCGEAREEVWRRIRVQPAYALPLTLHPPSLPPTPPPVMKTHLHTSNRTRGSGDGGGGGGRREEDSGLRAKTSVLH